MNNKYWIPIITGVICAILFFFIGMSYGKTSTATTGRTGFSSSTRGGFAGRAGAGGGFVAGTIVATGSSTITVQLANGNSEVVLYSNSTSIVKPSPATASALTPGATVMIGGTTNSDGSVTASTIQIRNGSSTGGFGGGGGQQ